MNFDFTAEQAMMRDGINRYLSHHYAFSQRQAALSAGGAHSGETWTHFRDQGILALPIGEEGGGLGGSIVDIVALSELFGAHLVVEPYLSSIVMAGRALARAGANGDAAGWLGRILAGQALAAFAHDEGKGCPDASAIRTRAEAVGRGFRLSGEKRLVLGGADADVLIVSARSSGATDRFVLLAIGARAAGVAATPLRLIDGRGAAHVRFDNVEVPESAVLACDGGEAIAAVIGDGMIALAAEAVGAMGALMHATTAYAATRKQFGRPIGAFQVTAHRLADMKMAYVQAQACLFYTAALAEAGRAGPEALSVLKGLVGRSGVAIGEAAVQIHGGIGMTDELSIGHLLKRLLVIDAMFGDADYHARAVGGGWRQKA
ncbi:acyl-CoA dehydrogenase family protein [Zavarzinia aquatilis]|uniref:Pilus assembly protein CpaB n=1 Tax=Zavarzinia aquatilis TaxID=2211142 RepID=A0A317EGU9_9PROT|nr:acyl-CoA dehydrogenase [Zavarzinia aquatilis]PWR25320.1 pilus assembly protein CpaB [Zavarzinia aquatilis]